MVFWCLVSWVLYIFWRSALYQMWGWWRSFSHSVGCRFVLFTVSFALQKLFSFRKSHLLIVTVSFCATGVIFRKCSFVPVCSRRHSTFFFSIRFNKTEFILSSLIHLDLSFVHCNRYGSICNLLHVGIQLCNHHLLKILSFFHCTILASLSKIRWS